MGSQLTRQKIRFEFNILEKESLDFVADYNQFVEMCEGYPEIHNALKQFFEMAWSKTIMSY
ncbi:MAG: hypothetical protein ABI045_06380 [Flavobacteriales bacterium]